jgi:transcription elongation factor Elf1
MNVSSVHRTLEHELFALLRGASLECPVCGEFVLHDGAVTGAVTGAVVRCPECEMLVRGGIESNVLQVQFGSQAG